MRKPIASRLVLAAGGTALVMGLSACASGSGYSTAPNRSGSVAPRDMGQMGTQGTSQGESGTPHTMGRPGTAPASSPQPAGGTVMRRSDMGQMGTQGTSQGETGTPHNMGGPGTASQPSGTQAPGSSVRPNDMGQMGTQGTSQGETGTPHKH